MLLPISVMTESADLQKLASDFGPRKSPNLKMLVKHKVVDLGKSCLTSLGLHHLKLGIKIYGQYTLTGFFIPKIPDFPFLIL